MPVEFLTAVGLRGSAGWPRLSSVELEVSQFAPPNVGHCWRCVGFFFAPPDTVNRRRGLMRLADALTRDGIFETRRFANLARVAGLLGLGFTLQPAGQSIA